MGYWVVVGIAFALLTCSLWRDLRRFRNCIYLLIFLIFLFLAVADTLHDQGMLQTGFAVLCLGLVPLGWIAVAGLLLYDAVVVVKKEGLHFKNLLAGGVGLGMLGFAATLLILFSNVELSRLEIALLLFVDALMAYLVFTFVALLLYSLLYSLLPKRRRCDYIIVHGGGLLGGERVSPLLAGRLEKAREVWLRGGCRATLVLSGGQGGDEKISEALAMQSYLVQRRFPLGNVILEDRSTTTLENLRNSKAMMDARGMPYSCIFVTSNYHVFRTALYARKLGLKAEGIGCKTALYYWPGAFIREYVAVMMQFKWAFVAYTLLAGAGIWLAIRPF